MMLESMRTIYTGRVYSLMIEFPSMTMEGRL